MILWKDITRGTARYRVFSDGSILGFYRNSFLRQYTDKDGYRVVSLGGKAEKVHRVVLSAFVREPVDGEICRHLDGDPSNNCLSNIAWGSLAENWQDKRDHGRATVGAKHGRSKVTESDVERIRSLIPVRGSLKAEANRLGISYSAIQKIRSRSTWNTL